MEVEQVAPPAAEKTRFEDTTDIGGTVVVNVVPAKKFAKQQMFSVVYTSPAGEELTGNFIVKRMALGEQSQVGVTKAMLARSLQVDSGTDTLLHMFSYLQHALLDKPEWFKPAEMFDEDLILAVYRRCLAFEASFRKSVSKQGAGD
jgi:hypothetical protein